jgi:hypothetical protein
MAPQLALKVLEKRSKTDKNKTCMYHKGEEGVVFHLLIDIVLAL